MTLFPRVSKIGWFDTETTGLGPDAVPVGLSYSLADGQKAYLRWGHERGGNNVDVAQVREWWNKEVARGVLAVFHNAVYDLRMIRAVGFDLPEQVDDTCVIAALLDEYEPSYSLENLCIKHLGPQHVKASDDLNEYCRQVFDVKKGKEAGFYHRCPGDLVEPYAEQDANLTRLLWLCLQPKIAVNGLTTVHDMERALMPVLVRMYRAGVRVDAEKAEKLKHELVKRRDEAQAELFKLNHGVELNCESTAQVAQLLESLGITAPKTEAGNASVTKDFLKTVEHPVAKLIITSKQAKHYSNVFIDNYIFKNITPHSFIHPSFHQAKSAFGGARTGRFSSAGGLNAQNIPKRDKVWAPLIRGLFIPAYDGGQWLRCDFCLAGETEVETTRGKKQIKDIMPGDKVFSWKNGRITWGNVSASACVGMLPAWRLTLDSGEAIIASGDHKMVMRDGELRKISALAPGDSLAAIRKGTDGLKGYPTFYSWSNRLYSKLHRLVAEAHFGPCPPGHEVHHKDRDAHNYGPDNLEYLPISVHRALDAWTGVDEEKRVAALRVGLKARRSYAGEGNPRWKGGKIEVKCTECDTMMQLWPSQAWPGRRCSACFAAHPRRRLNHKVTLVEDLGLMLPMYQLTVDEHHNYALGAGVISANSQIEYRLFAHYAGGAVMQRYVNEPDVDFHQMVADLTGMARDPAKNINFGILFGMGEKKMAAQTGLPPDQANAALAAYHEQIPEARILAKRAMNKAAARGYIITHGGRRCRFQALNVSGRTVFTRTNNALNYLTQGSAADLIKLAMIAVDKEIDYENTILHLTIHDELDATVPPGAKGVREAYKIKEIMESVAKLRVPVRAEAEVGPNWGDCKPLPPRK